jgi:F0F1-type ATP synthase assembly protein I
MNGLVDWMLEVLFNAGVDKLKERELKLESEKEKLRLEKRMKKKLKNKKKEEETAISSSVAAAVQESSLPTSTQLTSSNAVLSGARIGLYLMFSFFLFFLLIIYFA